MAEYGVRMTRPMMKRKPHRSGECAERFALPQLDTALQDRASLHKISPGWSTE
jgi:hypothetical protein